jgi:chromosome segregation ATPase
MGSRTSIKPHKRELAYEGDDDGGGDNGNGTPQKKRKKSSPSPLAGRNINAAGKPPEAGVITRICVENFMCHRNFTIPLCRNVNFIHGQNGSGKSAILAAIQICLGASARRTNRARNLKELVRKGSNGQCAKIRVTVLNGGDDGYLKDVYGDTITVERTIALKGGYNGYKLLDHEGVEKSRSKKDLDDLLDRLNIQVENPVAILDQEEAKKFLTGKASDKYAFYMKATELERIDRTYQTTLDSMNDMDGQKVRMKKNLKHDQLLVKECKEEWDKCQELDKLKERQEKMTERFAWSCYQQAQNTLDLEMMVRT